MSYKSRFRVAKSCPRIGYFHRRVRLYLCDERLMYYGARLKNIHLRNGEPIWLTSFFAVASKTPCEPVKTVEHQKRPLGAFSNHSIQLGPS